jgi:DNA-binding NtrC family response regulator
MSNSKERLVWLVEDEPDLAECYAEILAQDNQKVQSFANPVQALDELDRNPAVPDVIVTDLRMPKMDGLGFIEAIRALKMRAPVILVSAHLERNSLLRAQQLGVAGILEKPVSQHDLQSEVERAYDSRSTLDLDAELVACLRARVSALQEGWELREQRLFEMNKLLNQLDPELYRKRSHRPEVAQAQMKDEILSTEIERLGERFRVLWHRSRLSD